jgi:hypothetical protein
MFFALAETMPQDAPSSLAPRDYADLLSYILKLNGMSAGDTELPVEMEALKRLRFTPP